MTDIQTAPALPAAANDIYTPEETRDALLWLCATIRSSVHAEISHINVSEWAAAKRVIPQGLSALPGKFSWDVTPYLKEIADCLSASSPVQEAYIAKGAQIGYSVGVLENSIGYIVDAEPGPALYATGDQSMAEQSGALRIDRMLQSAGIADKIFSQVETKSNRATGRTKLTREFPGGFLMSVGPNSAAKLRQNSVRYLLLDEIDAYPEDTQGEGDPIKLMMRRTDSYEAIRKIIGGSTPTIMGSSRIWELYLCGDQRKYYVPCRHCGTMQPLEWKHLHWDTDENGKLVYESVRYECPHCGGAWKNTDKAYFLPRGEWRPTASPSKPNLRSYHISALYSPVGMRSWESAVQEWLEAQGDSAKLRVFVNTFLGEPFVEKGEAPAYERIMLRRENWHAESRRLDHGTAGNIWFESDAPAEKILLVTIGADVQQDRIECEVTGWGEDKESWSLGYFMFYGNPRDASDTCWQDLTEVIQKKHAGRVPALTLVDSSYSSDSVYEFCAQFGGRGVLASQGADRTQHGKVFALFPVKGTNAQRVDLNTDYLKQEVYSSLNKIRASDTAPFPAAYCHFSADYGEHYFKMLTAEERMAEKQRRTGYTRWIWHKVRDRNEALDCRVYALGAVYLLASSMSNMPDGTILWDSFWDFWRQQKKLAG